MLQRLVQCVSGRQAVRKGFVLAGVRDLAAVRAIQADWDRQGGRPVSVSLLVAERLDTPLTCLVFLDSGLRWLCSRTERSRLRRDLATATVILGRVAAQHRAALLASGMDLGGAPEGRAVSVADEHVIEVFDDVERAVLGDAIRASLPVLIAIAARSRAVAQGAESLGSARLRDRGAPTAAPPLRAGGSAHLMHVERQLRRRGIRSFAQVDIDPRGAAYPGATTILVRALDGQVLVDTACAHALLLLALSLRARQSIEAPDPPPVPPGGPAARDLAAVYGLNARLDARGPTRRSPRPTVRASEAALDLIESLDWEFRSLGADFDEDLAPVALGMSLRRLGWAAFRSENDAIREALRGQTVAAPLPGVVAGQQLLGHDSLARLNAARFPEPAQLVRALWSDRLGAGSEPLSASQLFLTRLLRPEASLDDRLVALLGLYRETLCFDLQRLARRHLADRSSVLVDMLATPDQYRFGPDIARQRIEGYLDLVQRRRAVGLRVEAPSAAQANEVESRLFGEPLRGMVPFRIGQVKPAGPRVISHYLLIDERAP